jgi:hypothetical protein
MLKGLEAKVAGVSKNASALVEKVRAAALGCP